MSQMQNLPISLKVADEFLNSMNGDPTVMAAAARALMEEVKRARQVLTDGFNRKELTVCNGKLGYIDPKDAARFLSGDIPRLTVYKKKKDTHNMALFFKRPPKFHQKNQKAKPSPARRGSKR